MSQEPQFVKIRFHLERDADGWPPAESEGLWAVLVGENAYRVDNTPWLARNVAADDVFLAEPDADGRLWATCRLQASGNCTMRIISFKDGPLAGSRQAVLDAFMPLGASGEGAASPINIVAVTVPPNARIPDIKRALERGETDGSWSYEESCITPLWASS